MKQQNHIRNQFVPKSHKQSYDEYLEQNSQQKAKKYDTRIIHSKYKPQKKQKITVTKCEQETNKLFSIIKQNNMYMKRKKISNPKNPKTRKRRRRRRRRCYIYRRTKSTKNDFIYNKRIKIKSDRKKLLFSINVETFTKIFKLWFHTSNIQNSTMINVADIIKCSFKYYNIIILCSFKIKSDSGSFHSNSYSSSCNAWKIYSNGLIHYKIHKIEDEYEKYKCKEQNYLTNKLSNIQIQKLIALLTKTQINFTYKQYHSHYDYDYSEVFINSGKDLAQLYNINILDYSQTNLTVNTVNNFNELFNFITKTLSGIKQNKISEFPTFISRVVNTTVIRIDSNNNIITVSDDGNWVGDGIDIFEHITRWRIHCWKYKSVLNVHFSDLENGSKFIGTFNQNHFPNDTLLEIDKKVNVAICNPMNYSIDQYKGYENFVYITLKDKAVPTLALSRFCNDQVV